MATNYDPLSNRFRTFRFTQGSDLESLRQERIQDVLDIEELGLVYKTLDNLRLKEILVGLAFQPLHFLIGRTGFFKSMHAYSRVTIRTGFLILPYFWMKSRSYYFMQDLYHDILSKKVNVAYEDALTLKYKDLVSN
jgi:hypothetical protein